LRPAPATLSVPLILRVFRPEAASAQAQFESSVQNAASGLGFPTPPVLFTCTDTAVLGGSFVIMPRVSGRIMLDGMLGPGVLRLFRTLGRLHAQLHDLNVAAFEARMNSSGDALWVQDWITGDWMQEHVAAASLDGLAPGLVWMREREPSPSAARSVCHGDFHPINILMSGREVTGVIDWSMARVGDPAWDVGATAALMSQGPIDLPPVLYGLIGRARGWLVGRYLIAYAATRPLDIERVRYFEAVRCLGFLIEAGEHAQAAAGVIAPITKATAFADAHVQQGILRRFRKITGLALTLPRAPGDGHR
jgi:aminoglycoside phosphotransferase (APT) family kinase protein